MVRILTAIALVFASLSASAQVFTFECASSARLSGDSCDVCPGTVIESKSFNGLIIYLDSTFYKWIDQPYSIRVKPGQLIEYWEHSVNPYNERVTIPLDQTPFLTVIGMVDSTWCNSQAPNRFQYLNIDSFSVDKAIVHLAGDESDEFLKEGAGISFSWDADTLTISATATSSGTVTSVAATAPAAGFTISGSPITTAGTFVFTLANDLAAIEAMSGTGLVARTGSETYAQRTITAGTGISITNGDGVSGNPTITNSAPDQTVTLTGAGITSISGTYPSFTITSTEVDGSTTNELQTIDTFAIVSNVLRASLSSDGQPFKSVNLAPYLDNTDAQFLDTFAIVANVLRASISGDNQPFKSVDLSPYASGSNYQTFRDDNVDKTQRATANFVSSVRIAATLTDDAANGETEVSTDLVLNSVADGYLSQRGALSVMGRAANSTGNVADIVSTADGQVLRRSGTTLGFGTVATAGITDGAVTTAKIADGAVTYAKMQNVSATNRVLGRISAGAGVVEELSATSLYSILGFSGSPDRFALWTSSTALGSDAAFTFDATNDRMTITGTVAGLGANAAFLNLNSGPISGATTFLRASGNISSNLLIEFNNANNVTTAANTIVQNVVGGGSAGDPVYQSNITGASSSAWGLDNSDADKFKISVGKSVPGETPNLSFVITQDNPPKYGLNVDAPGRDVDIAGVTRAKQFVEADLPPVVTIDNPGTGLGTGGTIDAVEGGNNGWYVIFTTGTSPTNNGTLFTCTLNSSFTTSHYTVFCQGNAATANEFSKFVFNGFAPGTVKLKANGTLTASTTYRLNFVTIGK